MSSEERERQKEETGHSRWAGGLSWGAVRQVDLHSCPPNLKSLHRRLNLVQSHRPSRWSQYHITISRLYPWSSLWEEGEASRTYIPRDGGKRGSEESLIWGSSSRSTSSHILPATTSNTLIQLLCVNID